MNNKNQPFVSIITVCLNSEKYIEKTIQSLLDQSYQNLEYIVIDGGSRDRTLDIVRKCEPRFNGRMKWVSEEDSGIYNAFNKGIKLSTGEIIGIINSDDWYEENIIEEVVKAIEGYDLLHGQMRIVDGDGNTVAVYNHKKGNIRKYASTPYNHPTMFVKKHVYESLGLFDESYTTAGDYDFILRFYRSRFKDIFIKKIVTNFRNVGVTSRNKGVVNPGEIKRVLVNNGLPELPASIFVYYRFVRFKLSNSLNRFPAVIKIIRKIIPYHDVDTAE